MWGGLFGLRLTAATYASSDGVDAVSGFYREALAKYGPIVDCSYNKPKDRKEKNPSSRGIWVDDGGDNGGGKSVACGDDAPDVVGGCLFKVGNKADQRLFKLEPTPDGVRFDLVHLQLRNAT